MSAMRIVPLTGVRTMVLVACLIIGAMTGFWADGSVAKELTQAVLGMTAVATLFWSAATWRKAWWVIPSVGILAGFGNAAYRSGSLSFPAAALLALGCMVAVFVVARRLENANTTA